MKILNILILSGLIIFLSGCDKNDDNAFLKGNIVGFVNLIDEAGNQVEDKSGVIVELAGQNISANTNENGRFELTNVPAGTYNLTYNKTGYGSYKRFSFQFIGGKVPALLNETSLYMQPDTEIQSIDVSFLDNAIRISGTITEPDQFAFQIFLNDSSNVSSENFDFSSGRYGFEGLARTTFSAYIMLNETPYKSGDKIYLVLYFINPNEKWGYYDFEKSTYFYTSYKKALNTIDFVLK